jgi:hypothetical protein
MYGGKMTTRMIDALPLEIRKMKSKEIKQSIQLSEGRVICCETIGTFIPAHLMRFANAEIAAVFGADLLLFNMYNSKNPQIFGLPDKNPLSKLDLLSSYMPQGKGCTLQDVKDLTGRVIGVNLEPMKNAAMAAAIPWAIATPKNAKNVADQGADFICLTGNPSTGVTSQGIAKAAAEIKKEMADRLLIFAGKMHGAGTTDPVITEADIDIYADAGVDVILLPAPGTVPGITVEFAHSIVEKAHAAGMLVMSTIGTSQEASPTSTIEQIALMSKMAGADIHHLGDAGLPGLAQPDNIMALSYTIRGRSRTWSRMASVLRK